MQVKILDKGSDFVTIYVNKEQYLVMHKLAIIKKYGSVSEYRKDGKVIGANVRLPRKVFDKLFAVAKAPKKEN